MENASKALLIAGGVLIAILVASLGVYFSRSMSEELAKIYEKLEDNKRTEFNQQFINFNDSIKEVSPGTWKSQINIQDVVTIINLAKNSNKENDFGYPDDPKNPLNGRPTDPLNDKSLYVTVEYTGPIGTIGVEKEVFLEKLTNNEIDAIITEEMTRTSGLRYYECIVHVNSHTGYVNYIELK